MATAVIAAEGLGKRYVRGTVESRGMLRDSIMRFARNPMAALRQQNRELMASLDEINRLHGESEQLSAELDAYIPAGWSLQLGFSSPIRRWPPPFRCITTGAIGRIETTMKSIHGSANGKIE